LNHQLKFDVAWTSDTIGEERFKICIAAHHRHFNFYGGTDEVEFFAWLYPFREITNIIERIKAEQPEETTNESKKILQQFLAVWEYLAQNNYFPEFFLHLPKEIGFDYSNLVILDSKEETTFDDTIERLYCEEGLLEEETNSNKEKLTEVFQKQIQDTEKKFNWCVKSQLLDHRLEQEFFKRLIDLQQTSILEQKWFPILALQHYQINGVTEQELFFEFVHRNLFDERYLLRKECFEMLKSTFIFNPELILNCIDLYIGKHDLTSFLYGVSLLKACKYLIDVATGNSSESFSENIINHHKINSEHYSKLIPLYKKALQQQEIFLKQLLEKKAYWLKTLYWDKQPLDHLESYAIEEQLTYLDGALNCLRLIREPFKDLEVGKNHKKIT